MANINYEFARRNMVTNQLRPNKIQDERLLDRVLEVPREMFLPKDDRWKAYIDQYVSLGNDRYLFQPIAVAQLLQLAKIRDIDRVLLIGCGSGYMSAIAAGLASQVYAIDDVDSFCVEAAQNMKALGLQNVTIKHANLKTGYANAAPFDCIIVEGAVEILPPSFLEQLSDGGRIVYVEYVKPFLGKAKIISKLDNNHMTTDAFDLTLPLLKAFQVHKSFVF
ncbi:MAG: protein-L-isoaspartate O-methyltransferase [Rhodospirillaceae bacterium]|nr:protein-L-isoaspartate O-methyltransferase [Rhodospirillaceae bacterium]